MKNFIQPGIDLEITAAADVASGAGVLIGKMFGVAVVDIAEGARGNIVLTGVYSLPKAPSQAWTVGAKIFWDDAENRCTTVSTSNTLIGAAVEPVAGGAGDTIGIVRLNGSVA